MHEFPHPMHHYSIVLVYYREYIPLHMCNITIIATVYHNITTCTGHHFSSSSPLLHPHCPPSLPRPPLSLWDDSAGTNPQEPTVESHFYVMSSTTTPSTHYNTLAHLGHFIPPNNDTIKTILAMLHDLPNSVLDRGGPRMARFL